MSNGRHYPFVETLKELRHQIIEATSRMKITADTSGMAENLFSSYIEPVIEHYEPIVSPLASHRGDILYRARKCIDGVPFDNLQDLYNPPSPSGRAKTLSNMPILYASSSMQTCLSEIDPKIGDLVNVVGLKYCNIEDGKFWFIGQLASFYKSNEHSRYVSEKQGLTGHAYFPERAKHSFIFQDSLINEIFSTLSSQEDGYVLNRFLIDAIRTKLGHETLLRGVVFLSVKDSPGINFAIFGDAIEQLEQGQINLLRITDIDNYGFVSYEVLKNGRHENGKIEWPESEISY
ncbi:MAG: hypothetical protein COA78_32535 [Blastopirellula sp.]|nr:MAG: hypothetical protein COA78_32535 [Blastopirellula sp.]